MPAPSYTYTLTNDTTADATQVMQNFNDILNGISDGTKDVSINALTCAGTATLNGAINLGNASTDDLTVTGSLASSIAIKTTNSFAVGSATLLLSNIFSTQYTAAAGSTSVPGFTFVGSTTTGLYSSGTNIIDIVNNGNQTARIQANGDVSIGTTSDIAKLAVSASDASSNGVLFVQNSSATVSSGNVVARFKLSGGTDMTSAIFCKFEDADNSTTGSISAASATTVAFNTSSDARLKTNISDYNALNLVNKMNPVEYEFKKIPEKTFHGFIAQELYEILPEVVHKGSDSEEINGDPWMIDYGKLTGVLCKAIKELYEEVQTLKLKTAS